MASTGSTQPAPLFIRPAKASQAGAREAVDAQRRLDNPGARAAAEKAAIGLWKAMSTDQKNLLRNDAAFRAAATDGVTPAAVLGALRRLTDAQREALLQNVVAPSERASVQ